MRTSALKLKLRCWSLKLTLLRTHALEQESWSLKSEIEIEVVFLSWSECWNLKSETETLTSWNSTNSPEAKAETWNWNWDVSFLLHQKPETETEQTEPSFRGNSQFQRPLYSSDRLFTAPIEIEIRNWNWDLKRLERSLNRCRLEHSYETWSLKPEIRSWNCTCIHLKSLKSEIWNWNWDLKRFKRVEPV